MPKLCLALVSFHLSEAGSVSALPEKEMHPASCEHTATLTAPGTTSWPMTR
ncbi:MAG: hypothetical protein IH830_03845 [Planctomycetes bacterium]|nr:hypothetical protein [Planctomycetota bacterium]